MDYAGEQWRNRIVGYADVDPKHIKDNERNWRTHPSFQADSLEGVIREIGWLQDIIVNRRTAPEWGEQRGQERMIDGHLRRKLAIKDGQASVPVKYVDLSPSEEALALTTLDPIAAMAVADKEMLESLMRDVRATDPAVTELVSKIAEDAGVIQLDENANANDQSIELTSKFDIMISCASEMEQTELLNRFLAEGLACRALTF